MAFATAALDVALAAISSTVGGAVVMLWLVPQFVLMGMGDGFTLVRLREYFYEQVPDSMRNMGIGLYLGVIGAGNFLSSLVITGFTAADRATWFTKDLNRSRLDFFYRLLACISAINVAFYTLVAAKCSYKQTVRAGRVSDTSSVEPLVSLVSPSFRPAHPVHLCQLAADDDSTLLVLDGFQNWSIDGDVPCSLGT